MCMVAVQKSKYKIKSKINDSIQCLEQNRNRIYWESS